MGKQQEARYWQQLNEDDLKNSIELPWISANCGKYLIEIGAVMQLLPDPPARLLDFGCGAGWTSIFFAKRGYTVVGMDISPEAVYYANLRKQQANIENLEFIVGDYEECPFENEFDCVVFSDSLHHAVDLQAAVDAAYRSLRRGGVCIAAEPGKGHSLTKQSRESVQKYGVTENDAPPVQTIKAGRKAGFRTFHVYPHGREIGELIYGWIKTPFSKLAGRVAILRPIVRIGEFAGFSVYKYRDGIVQMIK